jgi:hypothetical protein
VHFILHSNRFFSDLFCNIFWYASFFSLTNFSNLSFHILIPSTSPTNA